jgi:hypothetical protein
VVKVNIVQEIIKRLPEKKRDESSGRERTEYPRGYNQALSEITTMLEGLEVGVDVEEIEKVISHIPSTHVPISVINDKVYYYMCKKDIAEFISTANIITIKERG